MKGKGLCEAPCLDPSVFTALAAGVLVVDALHWLQRSCGVREDIFPRGLTILKGAVPGLARGLGYTAPTYSVGSRDRRPTAIAAPRKFFPRFEER